MAQALDNYLRMYRKRTCLSQSEVAFLLGVTGGAKLSRYETMARRPSLESSLACQVVLGAPVGGLFAGVLEKVEAEVIMRAQVLAERLSRQKPDRRTLRKLERLQALAARTGPAPQKDGLSSAQ